LFNDVPQYDFHKTVQDPNNGEFQHQFFRQHKPELLSQIKRKANNRMITMAPLNEGLKLPMAGKLLGVHSPSPESSSSALTISTAPGLDDSLLPEELALEARALFKDLEQQKAQREGFEQVLNCYPDCLFAVWLTDYLLQRMEARLSELEGENQALKSFFIETHQKTLIMQERLEKVFKTMYMLVLGNGGRVISNKALVCDGLHCTALKLFLLTLSCHQQSMLLPDLQGQYGSQMRSLTNGPVDEGYYGDQAPSSTLQLTTTATKPNEQEDFM
jgi:hypothetical protein